MFPVRVFVHGLPVALLALAGLSFRSARHPSDAPRNEIVVATQIAPQSLNPLLPGTATDREAMALLYNGLVRFGENYECVGDLAKSWEQRQTSTCEFLNPLDAKAALAALKDAEESWESWNLVAAEIAGPEDTTLQLHFSMPGVKEPSPAFDLLDATKMKPITTIRVNLGGAARESAAHFLENTTHRGEIIRSWTGSQRNYELVIAGDAQPVLQELAAYYAANKSLAATVETLDKRHLLDEPELIFLLHESARWHDGDPVTAADVAFTWRAIVDAPTPTLRQSDFALVRSVEALGPDRVKINYRRPYSPALRSWTVGLLPEHILKNFPTDSWAENLRSAPVGTGPFKFGEWLPDRSLRLVRNAAYFEGAPHLDAIVFRPMPDPVAARLAFETGKIDLWEVPRHALRKMRADPRIEILSRETPGFAFVGWNLKNPLFADPDIRRALALGVDVEAIIRVALAGAGRPSDGTYPPSMWFHADVEVLPYDLKKARAILAVAGWKPGTDGILEKDGKRFAFRLIADRGTPTHETVASLIGDDLRKLGIEATVATIDTADFFARFVMPHEFDACVLDWENITGYDVARLWDSSQTDPGELNFVSYQNPEIDERLRQIGVEYDRSAIESMAAEIQRVVYRDQPYLFLYVPSDTLAIRRDALRARWPSEGEWLDETASAAAGGHLPFAWLYRSELPPAP